MYIKASDMCEEFMCKISLLWLGEHLEGVWFGFSLVAAGELIVTFT
jgi:hypothetical protein